MHVELEAQVGEEEVEEDAEEEEEEGGEVEELPWGDGLGGGVPQHLQVTSGRWTGEEQKIEVVQVRLQKHLDVKHGEEAEELQHAED